MFITLCFCVKVASSWKTTLVFFFFIHIITHNKALQTYIHKYYCVSSFIDQVFIRAFYKQTTNKPVMLSRVMKLKLL